MLSIATSSEQTRSASQHYREDGQPLANRIATVFNRAMTITNFGSCCIDNVYAVPWFTRPGETLPCSGYQVHPGGKGLNQSLALAYAGAEVRHAGKIGQDGAWLKELLDEAGVDTSLLVLSDAPSGHAVIQVTPQGENAIVIYGGANLTVGPDDFEAALKPCAPGDFLLIQNEISQLDALMEMAKARQQQIIFNAAPFTDAVRDYPLQHVSMFIVNELEAEALTGESDAAAILDAMATLYPDAATVLTLGEQGAVARRGGQTCRQDAFSVNAVDSTGAGDTFTGYFLAGLAAGKSLEICLADACGAAAICVTREGAASSIPQRDDQAWDTLRAS